MLYSHNTNLNCAWVLFFFKIACFKSCVSLAQSASEADIVVLFFHSFVSIGILISGPCSNMTLDKQLLLMYVSLYKMLLSMPSFKITFLKA